MSKYKIDCFAIEGNQRMWEVTPEGRVWPCCNFSNAYDKRHNKELNGDVNDESATLFNDPIMGKLMKDDPDFNSLEKHSFEEIIKHDAFEKYIHHEGWESDSPPITCVANCNICK